MTVDPIKSGIVLDHIPAGSGMKLYHLLGLDDEEGVSVALIRNVVSKKTGRKDIIKIDANIPIDFNIIAFAAPDTTVNIIRDGKVVEKKNIELPEVLTNVIKCKNPRCITSTEQELDQVFRLADRKTKTYRCIYCEAKVN